MIASAPGYSGEAGIELHHVRVGVDATYVKQDTRQPDYKAGYIVMTPMLLSLTGNIPISRRVRLQIGGGYGYMIVGRELDNEHNYIPRGYQLSEEIKGGETFAFKAGLEYRMSKRLSLSIQAKQFFFESKLITKLRDTVSLRSDIPVRTTEENINLNGIIAMAGVRWTF